MGQTFISGVFLADYSIERMFTCCLFFEVFITIYPSIYNFPLTNNKEIIPSHVGGRINLENLPKGHRFTAQTYKKVCKLISENKFTLMNS